MPIISAARFASEDIYLDYPFEEVMYRRDHKSQLIFVHFYGEGESPEPVPSSNRLFTDALRFGDEISRDEYYEGRAR